MPYVDRSIWILFLSGTAASATVLTLTGNWEATFACAIGALFAVAMLFDALERRAPYPRTAQPEPPSKGPSADEINTLLQALPHPCFIVHRGRIEHSNEAALVLLGRHIVGQDVRLALRHPAAIDQLTGANTASGPTRVEIVGLGTAEQSWELDIQPLQEERLLVFLFDQSGRQATERMRVDFVANASHELRTPLAGILGFVETLRDPVAGADAATRDRFLGIMEGEAKRMQRLVDDLMSLSRIEADKYRPPDQPIRLQPLAEEVVAIFRQSQNKRALDIVVAVDPTVPALRADRAQMSQLLHNLISNALKYGTPGTPVTLSARALNEEMVEVSVADQGDGITAEHLPRLTERFYRIDSSRSRVMGGTGLGLAIVKHIVQRHNGVLHFDSIVGTGTTVRVELPQFRAASESGSDPSSAPSQGVVTKT